MKKELIQYTPEEELQLLIEKSKKKYGRVYKTIVADEVIIWRMLKRSEFKEVMNMVVYKDEITVDEEGNEVVNQVMDDDATYDLRQEEIAKAVILYPVGIVENMAAVADIISTECMMKSGFGETPKTEQC